MKETKTQKSCDLPKVMQEQLTNAKKFNCHIYKGGYLRNTEMQPILYIEITGTQFHLVRTYQKFFFPFVHQWCAHKQYLALTYNLTYLGT